VFKQSKKSIFFNTVHNHNYSSPCPRDTGAIFKVWFKDHQFAIKDPCSFRKYCCEMDFYYYTSSLWWVITVIHL